MSLIHSVATGSKSLLEKLTPHLGVTLVELQLIGGLKLQGVITEIGSDYLSLLNPEQAKNNDQAEQETLIPFASILLIQIKTA